MQRHRIIALQPYMPLIEENKEKIIKRWLDNEDVQEILEAKSVNKDTFATKYAHAVLKYFIDVVFEKEKIGSCPVITRLLEYLKEKDVSSSELFMICINFRKAMIAELFAASMMSEEVYENVSYVFDENFRGVLQLFTDTIYSAKKEAKNFYEESIQDHLTKTLNRKRFDEIFLSEFRRSQRYAIPMSLIMFDIDNFKKINDTYGHSVGDDVLIALAELIKKLIRDSDAFARWGGEEFIILLPHTVYESARLKAENLRRQIELCEMPSVGSITCSFGVTSYQDTDSKESFFRRVDEALYEAKEAGKNRVIAL